MSPEPAPGTNAIADDDAMLAFVRTLPPGIPRYERIPQWQSRSGMSRSVVYERAGMGDIRIVKCGSTSLIDVWYGLYRMSRLPIAQIAAPKPRETVTPQAVANIVPRKRGRPRKYPRD